MNCPVCKKTLLNKNEIEVGLVSLDCPKCSGKWISFQAYEAWLEQKSDTSGGIPGGDGSFSIPEFELARLCPRCRRILVKYKVGNDIPFKIDRCGNCAGVWLDADEWETLRSRGLHDELDRIFTDHWQKELNRVETRRALESIYRSKFGEKDYKKIKEFKKWLDEHDKDSEIISFLRDKNPLQF